MINMDQKLAELYGTTQPDETDVEKLAAAELAESLSDGQEVDVESLSDEDVEALASQVLASETGEEAPAGDQEEDPQEKVAEADYLGRVMAHAYVQELRGIEKKAAAEAAAAEKSKTAGKGGKVMAALGKAKKAGAMPPAFMKGKEKKEEKKEEKESGEEKKSSALDTLAERRAVEICEANGIDPSKLEKVEAAETTKVSSAEALEAAVNKRAVEMLAEYGVEVK